MAIYYQNKYIFTKNNRGFMLIKALPINHLGNQYLPMKVIRFLGAEPGDIINYVTEPGTNRIYIEMMKNREPLPIAPRPIERALSAADRERENRPGTKLL